MCILESAAWFVWMLRGAAGCAAWRHSGGAAWAAVRTRVLLLVRPLQVETAADIAAADKLVFPGVGAFGRAMEILEARGYTQALKDYVAVSSSSLRGLA